MQVGVIVQHRESCLDLAKRQRPDTLHGGTVDGHPGRAKPGVEKKLNEGPAERVPHDDRLRCAATCAVNHGVLVAGNRDERDV
jgi:hypothetical protein